ncbi:MAG: hypothetical protein JKX83_00135 [Pseudomonadales bacterium]|nr:hypothetical protein [Pseudomonadales bacterium]
MDIATNSPAINATNTSLKMPPYFLYTVLAICFIPYLLTLMGVNLASSSKPVDLQQLAGLAEHQQLDLYFARLSGAFTHTILEWTAFCIAIMTVFLAASHYFISKNLTTLIIGAALFLAGCMDAFHTLAADRLIEAVADNRDLVPFTWAICRVFNALILIGGVMLLLSRSGDITGKADFKVLGLSFIGTAVVAYGIISYCALSDSLPQTQFPDNIITRPYDVVPLVLYLVSGLFLFPYFYRRNPSVFAHALVIAMIPEVMVEMHMAFGSTALFDQHFNIAHFLKIFAYAVPFLGLLMDYIHTYQQKQSEVEARERTQQALNKYTVELERSNKELNDFAYVASHDLKAPLRGIMQLASWIEDDIKDDIKDQTREYIALMHSRTRRLEQLLNDLLAFSRVGRKHGDFKTIGLAATVTDLYQLLNPPLGFSLHCDIKLSAITTLFVPLEQVLRNLINNAIKHHPNDTGTLRVTAITTDTGYEFAVTDDGAGILPEHHERIFGIFQTLKPRDEVEGSGMGLAIIKKLLDTYHCRITVESDGIKGTTMRFTWPSEPTLRMLTDDH